MRHSIRHLLACCLLTILTSAYSEARNPVKEYVGHWTGELTIRHHYISGETHKEWEWHIQPSFEIGEDGSLVGTAKVRFAPIDFSIGGTRCAVITPERDEYPMAGGFLWHPYGTTDTLLGSLAFYLPSGPGGSASFKGDECLACTSRFGYEELPDYVLEALPHLLRGTGTSGDGPNCFSFAKKTLIDLEKVKKSLGVSCISVEGSAELARPPKTLAMSYEKKDVDESCRADGIVYQRGKQRPLEDGTHFQRGDEITTGPDSRVKIELDRASALHVNKGTQIRLESESEIDLILGEVLSKIKPGADYSVRTPQAVSSVRGTQFITRVDKDRTSTLIVLEGEVEFYDRQKKKSVLVRQSQTSVCKVDRLPSEPVPIDPDTIPRWWE